VVVIAGSSATVNGADDPEQLNVFVTITVIGLFVWLTLVVAIVDPVDHT
jgi:hypothetical protein